MCSRGCSTEGSGALTLSLGHRKRPAGRRAFLFDDCGGRICENRTSGSPRQSYNMMQCAGHGPNRMNRLKLLRAIALAQDALKRFVNLGLLLNGSSPVVTDKASARQRFP